MKLSVEINFDGLASCFGDYEDAKRSFWNTRKRLGYRKGEIIWIPTAPKELKDAINHADVKSEGVNTLWYTSHALYKATAMTRRLDTKYMMKHKWECCLSDSSLERLMAYYTKEDQT